MTHLLHALAPGGSKSGLRLVLLPAPVAATVPSSKGPREVVHVGWWMHGERRLFAAVAGHLSFVRPNEITPVEAPAP